MMPRPPVVPISSAVLNELSELRRVLPPDLDRTQVDELHRFVENTYGNGYLDGGTRARVEHSQQVEASRRQAELDADDAEHPDPEPCEHPHLLQVAGPSGPDTFREGDYVRLSWAAGTVHDVLTFRDGGWWVHNYLVLVLGRQLDPAERGHERTPDQDATPDWVTWWCDGDHPAAVGRFRDPKVPGGTYHSCGKVFNEHGWIDQGVGSVIVCPGQQVSVNTVVEGRYLVRDRPDE
jgi:hypothetical protein